HDLGRLVAHLLLVDAVARIGERRLADRLRALLEGYQGGVGAILHRPTLDWHVAASLLHLAERIALRPLLRGWYLHVDYAVLEAERLLRGERDLVRRRDKGRPASSAASIR
ncbi:MAG: hypothetical protein HKM95_08730, partial [Inquilinus sp.]|nr:hypothetical protein [Inquilinus sp.]